MTPIHTYKTENMPIISCTIPCYDSQCGSSTARYKQLHVRKGKVHCWPTFDTSTKGFRDCMTHTKFQTRRLILGSQGIKNSRLLALSLSNSHLDERFGQSPYPNRAYSGGRKRKEAINKDSNYFSIRIHTPHL